MIKSILLLAILLVLGTTGCAPRKPAEQEPAAAIQLVVYEAKDTLMPGEVAARTIAVFDRYVLVPEKATLQEQVSLLADSLSKIRFNNLDIEVLSIQQTSYGQILLQVNLSENEKFKGPGSLAPFHSWYDFFQGSAGGLSTSVVLAQTMLQPDYDGKWIDEVEFFYQGKPIAEGDWDHLMLHGRIKLQ